jgi:hypothetical protein
MDTGTRRSRIAKATVVVAAFLAIACGGIRSVTDIAGGADAGAEGSRGGSSSSGSGVIDSSSSDGSENGGREAASAQDATTALDATTDDAFPLFGSDATSPPPSPRCNLPGLWCYQTTNCTTSLSGTVYDPAGKNPLYNVVVYVPSDPSKPLPTILPGTNSCSACAAQIGDYMAVGVTDAKGHFTMTGVPATTNVPIVIQIGKWRREVLLAKIAACTDNKVADKSLRLPKSRKEGDMPQMGLLTGGCDDLGCFMKGIGIDDSEFSAPRAGGRLDIYQGNSSSAGIGGSSGPGLTSGGAGNCSIAADAGAACPLWSTRQALEYYDLVFLACECDEHNETKPPSAMTAMHDWLNEGGKVLATHYNYTWFMNGPADFQGVATWLGASVTPVNGPFAIDNSPMYPKGQVLQDWLNNLGAASGGAIALNPADVRTSVSAVNPPTTRWIYDTSTVVDADGGSRTGDTKYLSFLTPVGGIAGARPDGGSCDAGGTCGPTYCGKAVFTDIHTSGAPSGDVPGACSGADLTPQQKALEFMLFDLAACVAPENRLPPAPPPPPPPPPPM